MAAFLTASDVSSDDANAGEMRVGPCVLTTGLPVELVPVIARLSDHHDSDEEPNILVEIRRKLRAPVGSARGLSLPLPIVLHDDAELQRQEHLLVGGNKSPDESLLLRDYLRLFGKIVPPDRLCDSIPSRSSDGAVLGCT